MISRRAAISMPAAAPHNDSRPCAARAAGGRCGEFQRGLSVAEVECDACSEQRRRGRPVVVADHALSDPCLFGEVGRLRQQAGGVRQLGSVREHDRRRCPRRSTCRIVHQAPALSEVAGAGGDPSTVVQEVRGERQLAELETTLLGVDRVSRGRFEVAHVGVRQGAVHHELGDGEMVAGALGCGLGSSEPDECFLAAAGPVQDQTSLIPGEPRALAEERFGCFEGSQCELAVARCGEHGRDSHAQRAGLVVRPTLGEVGGTPEQRECVRDRANSDRRLGGNGEQRDLLSALCDAGTGDGLPPGPFGVRRCKFSQRVE